MDSDGKAAFPCVKRRFSDHYRRSHLHRRSHGYRGVGRGIHTCLGQSKANRSVQAAAAAATTMCIPKSGCAETFCDSGGRQEHGLSKRDGQLVDARLSRPATGKLAMPWTIALAT